MFLHSLENSSCQREGLEPGIYVGVQRLYLSKATATKIIYIEWHLEESQVVSAAELWVIEEGGSIKGMDFMQMPDGSWSDGDGLRTNNLEELMPLDELGTAEQISEEIVGPEFVGAI